MATTPETPKTAPLPFTTLDPYAVWQKMMTESLARWQTFAEQYAAIEAQVSTHAQAAVTHCAQIAKDAIAYGTQLSAEARKLSVETAKKMGVGA